MPDHNIINSTMRNRKETHTLLFLSKLLDIRHPWQSTQTRIPMQDTHTTLLRDRRWRTRCLYCTGCRRQELHHDNTTTTSPAKTELKLYHVFLPLPKLVGRGKFHFQERPSGWNSRKVIDRMFCNLHDNYYLYHQNNKIRQWIIYRQPYWCCLP